MLYRLAAAAVLVAHFAFILFALFGAMAAARHRWFIALHLPAAAWGFFVELTGRTCPLTYAENYFRELAGQAGYSGSFVEHYLLPIVYPAELTPGMQLVLSGVVVAKNAVIYGWLFTRWHRGRRADA
jgi:hypothetical protein